MSENKQKNLTVMMDVIEDKNEDISFEGQSDDISYLANNEIPRIKR